jgi:hypothetical protein
VLPEFDGESRGVARQAIAYFPSECSAAADFLVNRRLERSIEQQQIYANGKRPAANLASPPNSGVLSEFDGESRGVARRSIYFRLYVMPPSLVIGTSPWRID